MLVRVDRQFMGINRCFDPTASLGVSAHIPTTHDSNKLDRSSKLPLQHPITDAPFAAWSANYPRQSRGFTHWS
jgi:hypothetical protein